MDLDEMKQLFKDSIDEAKTPIDLFGIILVKTYQKGVDDAHDTTRRKLSKIDDHSYRYFCECCGNEATPQDKFCRGCGRKIIE